MKRLPLLLALAVCASSSLALPTAAPVRSEIDALLAKLSASGCRFNRNGSWYSAPEARDHLMRKLEYIEGSNMGIRSTEQFIDLAASRSSISGKAYQVKCGNEAAVDSQAWLTRQLDSMRAPAGKVKQ